MSLSPETEELLRTQSFLGQFHDPKFFSRVLHMAMWLVGIIVVGLAVGLSLVGRTGKGPIHSWDETVNSWVLAHQYGLVGASKIIATVGDAALLGVIVAVITIVLILLRFGIRGTVLAAAYLGAEFTVFAVRKVILRPRPYSAAHGTIPGVQETGYSFPSGHATATAAIFFALAVVVIGTRRIIWPWVVAFVASCATAGSRLVLGVHWFSDVTVGLVLGAVWGAASARILLAPVIPKRVAPRVDSPLH